MKLTAPVSTQLSTSSRNQSWGKPFNGSALTAASLLTIGLFASIWITFNADSPNPDKLIPAAELSKTTQPVNALGTTYVSRTTFERDALGHNKIIVVATPSTNTKATSAVSIAESKSSASRHF